MTGNEILRDILKIRLVLTWNELKPPVGAESRPAVSSPISVVTQRLRWAPCRGFIAASPQTVAIETLIQLQPAVDEEFSPWNMFQRHSVN